MQLSAQRRWLTRVLVVLLVLVAAAAALLGLRSYHTLTLLTSAYEAGTAQASSVRPWMTLRYVATAYGAPEAALRASLELPPEVSA